MTIYYSDIENFDDEFFSSSTAYYPEKKKHSMLNSKNETAKRESILAWRIVSEFCKGKGEVLENEHGKPYFEKGGSFFSISHSVGKVIVAVDEHEVGADIQKIRHASDEVARRVLSENEIEVCSKSADKAFCFTKFWTLRECYTKFYGTSITQNLNSLDFSKFLDDESFSYKDLFFYSVKRGDFSVSVCSENSLDEIVFRQVNQTDF